MESEHNIDLHNSHQLAAFLGTTSPRVSHTVGTVSPSMRRFPAGYNSACGPSRKVTAGATSSVRPTRSVVSAKTFPRLGTAGKMPAGRTGKMPVLRKTNKGEKRMRFLVLMIPEVYQPKNGRKTDRASARMPRGSEAGPVQRGAEEGRRAAFAGRAAGLRSPTVACARWTPSAGSPQPTERSRGRSALPRRCPVRRGDGEVAVRVRCAGAENVPLRRGRRKEIDILHGVLLAGSAPEIDPVAVAHVLLDVYCTRRERRDQQLARALKTRPHEGRASSRRPVGAVRLGRAVDH